MTAVLGLPCFGFVAGALLAAAATLPSWQIMAIFTALGVGMAFPYLLLAAFPAWLEKIPRTGPASELVKQVMGLLLLAAAAYFIGSGLIALVADYPYLARELHWWVIAILAGLAGLWLIVRTFAITPSPGKRGVLTIVGLIIAGAAAGYAMDTTLTAQKRYTLRQQAYAAAMAQGDRPLLITTTWMDYEPGLPDRAIEAGYTVVMDFTAEWCLNCKALKAAVLNVDPVSSRLAEDDVVSITVDLTSRNAPGWELLRAYGRTGIPLLVVLKPGADPWLANNYTAGQVMQAVGPSKASPAPLPPADAENQR
jgi:thiol:disulfide interchange protein